MTRLLALFAVLALFATACGSTGDGFGAGTGPAAGAACSATATATCGYAGASPAVLVCTSGFWNAKAICPGATVCLVGSAGPECAAISGAAEVAGTDAVNEGDESSLSPEIAVSTDSDGSSGADDGVLTGCQKPSDCNDKDPCTADECNAATLTCNHVALVLCGKPLTACATSKDCGASTVCDPSMQACVGCLGNADCGVGNRCLQSQCVPSVACQSDMQCKSSGGICDVKTGVCVPCVKDSHCGAGQQCKGQSCVAKQVCVSSKDCEGVCDEAMGLCVGCVADLDCATGNYCGTNAECKPVVCTKGAGACVGGQLWGCSYNGSAYYPKDTCEDDNPCTADGCNAGACTHTGLAGPGPACDDGNPCTANEACKNGACIGTAPPCDDGLACTVDACAPAAGCTHTADNTKCDDGKACTDDTCASSGCQHANQAGKCDDGNPCTTNDLCSAGGECKGVGPVCGNGTCECGETNASCSADCISSEPAGMVLIPGGTFWMGCNGAKDTICSLSVYEKPQHKVTLSAYYIDLTETTVGQYKACVDSGGCSPPSAVQPTKFASYPGLTSNPVIGVSWTQSQAYCKWRGAAFDLPTEAQWEMAARGSCEKNGSFADDPGCAAAMRTYPWGESAPTANVAVFGIANGTAPVGSTTAGDSPYGLHDMAGNAYEWTRDWYDSYSPGAVTDPLGPGAGSLRVVRGGAFLDTAYAIRAGYRQATSTGISGGGLRCVRAYPATDPCAGGSCPDLPCTTSTCAPGSGKCVTALKANATPCSDDNPCTLNDVCTSGKCKGAPNCDDANACTNDACVNQACQHVNVTGACDDGNSCTLGDVCTAGVCKGVGPVCGDGVCDCSETNANCSADCPNTTPAGMVLVPAGTFWMGCNTAKEGDCAPEEKPQHKVTLSAYYVDVTETTVGQYKACVDAGACTAPGSAQPIKYATYPGLTNNPVNFVNWAQSQTFCKWRGAAFDLPTEAQWEMAARGSCEKNGSTAGDIGCAAAMRIFPWGNKMPTAVTAIFATAGTAPVGSTPAGDSPFGLHDIAGNVLEWNRDPYGAYKAGPVTDPMGTGDTYNRVVRGGRFDDDAIYLRAGFRYGGGAAAGNQFTGVRCVRSYP